LETEKTARKEYKGRIIIASFEAMKKNKMLYFLIRDYQ